MDKYDFVFDIVEHPEKYSEQQIAELLSDPEAKEIYNLLCKTAGALKGSAKPDVNAEWQLFSRRHIKPARRPFAWSGSRAASIAAIVFTSLVAVAAGIAVTVAVIDRKPETTHEFQTYSAEPDRNQDVINNEQTDTMTADQAPVIFENQSLETIMKAIADAYSLDIVFNNPDAAELHLYYKFNPSLPIDEIISQLNTFEQITITHVGETLTVD